MKIDPLHRSAALGRPKASLIVKETMPNQSHRGMEYNLVQFHDDMGTGHGCVGGAICLRQARLVRPSLNTLVDIQTVPSM